MFGVEGVLHPDGDILNAYRIDGRRIDDLRTEITQLHRLDIRQLVDGIGCLDYLWVGCHETVNVSPYLQHLSVQHGSDDGCGIVRAASSEIGCLVRIPVSGNKSRHHIDGLVV